MKKEVEIVNKLGLHARAAAKFVHKANEYKSRVFLDFNSQRVNGKSIMGLLMLAAPVGSKIELETDGVDEEEAMAALSGMIADRFGEKE